MSFSRDIALWCRCRAPVYQIKGTVTRFASAHHQIRKDRAALLIKDNDFAIKDCALAFEQGADKLTKGIEPLHLVALT